MFRIALILIPTFLLLGCGESGPVTYPVSGKVTFDGEPLPDGDISFNPVDGGVPQTGKIVNGEYALEATEGEKKVVILATKDGPVDPTMGAAAKISYIPARYNASTELTATVTTDAEKNKFDFPLESK